MRDTKFRAWNKITKQMVYNVFPRESDGSVVSFSYAVNPKGTIIAVELMQYTGLKDCNGMEIYEGDILSIKGNSKNYEVYYEKSHASYFLKNTEGVLFGGIVPDLIVRIKVIGNIFENPELLSKKNPEGEK